MASGSGTSSAVPSMWIQGPKKSSVKTHRGWVASKVADLVGRLPAADNHLPVTVDPDDDRRGLEAAWPRCCHKAPACWACPGGSATGSRLGPPAGAARSPTVFQTAEPLHRPPTQRQCRRKMGDIQAGTSMRAERMEPIIRLFR